MKSSPARELCLHRTQHHFAMSISHDEEPVASTSAQPLAGGEERQIAIRLTTKDASYSIPSTKFLVPVSWRRFHLSELINKVLENCKYPLHASSAVPSLPPTHTFHSSVQLFFFPLFFAAPALRVWS